MLTAERAFLCLSLFNVVQLYMTRAFPCAISLGAEIMVSIKRIQDFLSLEEREEPLSVVKEEEEDWSKQWHAHLALVMTKISILFTGLLGVFVMYKEDNQTTRISTPVTKKKMTMWRILRNVYCHYGTCGILWYLGPDLKQIHPLHNSIVLILWLGLTHPWLTKIYDVEQLRTSQLVLPLAALAFLSDGVLMTLYLRLQRNS